MAKKVKNYRTDKQSDSVRKAKPSGYRYSVGNDKDHPLYYSRPTAGEIAKYKAGDAKMKSKIYYEGRIERADKNQAKKLVEGGDIELKKGGTVKRTPEAIKQDKSIKAKKGGKRISEDGNVYYENRQNRSDKDLRKKLKDGGEITKETYRQHLDQYDLLGAHYEDTEDETDEVVRESKRKDLKQQMDELESKIHRYERADEYKKDENKVYSLEVQKTEGGVWEQVNENPMTKAEAEDMKKAFEVSGIQHHALKIDYPLFKEGGEVKKEEKVETAEDKLIKQLSETGRISKSDLKDFFGRALNYREEIGGIKIRKPHLHSYYVIAI